MQNRIMEYVQERLVMEVKNNITLKRHFDDIMADILLEGNNIDTENELIDFFTNNDELVKFKYVDEIALSLGRYVIREAINKDFMDELIKTESEDAIETILESLKDEYEEIFEYTVEELEDMVTITQGQDANLKQKIVALSTDELRVVFYVWLSRMTVEDGEEYNNKVFVSIFVNGSEHDVVTYQANSLGC